MVSQVVRCSSAWRKRFNGLTEHLPPYSWIEWTIKVTDGRRFESHGKALHRHLNCLRRPLSPQCRHFDARDVAYKVIEREP